MESEIPKSGIIIPPKMFEGIIAANTSRKNMDVGEDAALFGRADIEYKIINDKLNIYGQIYELDCIRNQNIHLRIDLISKKVLLSKCHCSEQQRNPNFLCRHLAAAAYRFLQDLYRNENKKEKEEKAKEITEKIKISVELKIDILKDMQKNYLSLYAYSDRKKNKYLINDIGIFIRRYRNKKKYGISSNLMYNPHYNEIDEKDGKFLKYIHKYAKPDQNNPQKIIEIPEDDLKNVLEFLENEKIQFTYKYIKYNSKIFKKNMPLIFTIKKEENFYCITTQKKLPLFLDKNKEIAFYRENIYLPEKKQIMRYMKLYQPLAKKNMIRLRDDVEEKRFFKFVKSIMDISEKVNFDSETSFMLSKSLKPAFDLYEEDGKKYCILKIKGIFLNDSYQEVMKMDYDPFNAKYILQKAEMILNRYSFILRKDRFEFIGKNDEYYNFLKYGLKEIEKQGLIKINEEDIKNFTLRRGRFNKLSLTKKDSKTYNFCIDVDGINSAAEMKEISKSFKRKESFFKLSDGTYLDLNSEELKCAADIISGLKNDIDTLKHGVDITIDKVFYLNEKLNELEREEKCQKENKKIIQETLKEITRLKDKAFRIPKGLNCTLKSYQQEGYRWLRNLHDLEMGGILSDEMGLGKTVQVISFIQGLGERNLSLIVVPASLAYNWKKEFEKFSTGIKVQLILGNKEARKKELEKIRKKGVIITTYGILKNEIEFLENIHFNTVILDEGQVIKNAKSVSAQMVKRLKSDSKFILTGTPIENNLMELWSLFDFIMPGYLGTYREFSNRYDKLWDGENAETLKLLIKPYMLRRTKKDVKLNIPEKSTEVSYVELKGKQKELYNLYLKTIKAALLSGETSGINVLSYIMRLRQIALDPMLVEKSFKGKCAKIEKAMKIINENVREHKILVFSQFPSVLKKVEKILEKNNIKSSYLDGSVSSKDRMKLVEEFNAEKEKRIFLISLKAGGVGLNLTSADMVIHFDPWWNAAVEEQANDRVHRIGQKNNVKIIKLIAEKTIEEKIINLQKKKKALVEEVLTSDLQNSKVISSVTNKELMELILNS